MSPTAGAERFKCTRIILYCCIFYTATALRSITAPLSVFFIFHRGLKYGRVSIKRSRSGMKIRYEICVIRNA